MEMKNMKLGKSEMKETMAMPDSMKDAPKYPYGLRLNLNDETMKKLSLKPLPGVGSKMMLHAMVEVDQVSENSTQDGKRQDMSLQITEMGLEPYVEKKEPQEALYGK